MTIENMLDSAVASIEMEGFHIKNEYKEWCLQYMRNEITMEQYIQLVLEDVNIHI